MGLFLISGIFTREIVLVALIPTNLTLTVFNWSELIGHLPIYGILAILLIWEPGPKNLLLWIRGLRERPLPSGPVTGESQPLKAETPSASL